MGAWNAADYLRFADERTQPCRDLVGRIALSRVRRAIDLGCGPGNSTAIMAERWPEAEITGLDSSPEMLRQARESIRGVEWREADIAEWASDIAGQPYDLVFSNAALQWVPDHGALFPELFARVAPGGALALQMPDNFFSPAHLLMREMVTRTEWKQQFPEDKLPAWQVQPPATYYDLLTSAGARVTIWTIEYVQPMAGPELIVEWYRSTGLRPYLAALTNEEAKSRFLGQYLEGIRAAYRRQPDGKVLFPFRRLFVVAYRSDAV